jgi:hypothetical protein
MLLRGVGIHSNREQEKCYWFSVSYKLQELAVHLSVRLSGIASRILTAKEGKGGGDDSPPKLRGSMLSASLSLDRLRYASFCHFLPFVFCHLQIFLRKAEPLPLVLTFSVQIINILIVIQFQWK